MINKQELLKFIEENPKLVKIRPSVRYPELSVVKYTRKVFYDALWNDILEECRGLVLNKNMDPVIVPFKKIYNRGENNTDFPLDEKVTMVRKVNGFMAAATFVEEVNDVVISTTGSLDSDFVTLAEKWLRPSIVPAIKKHGHGITWLFEICDPSDPHIIEELPGPYLIGARTVLRGSMFLEKDLDYFCTQQFAAMRPNHLSNISFGTVVELAKKVQHEGFVVHGKDKSLKIKTPFYLFSKFIARCSADKFEDIMDGKYDQTIDEEFYPLLDHLRKKRDLVVLLDEQPRLDYIRKFYYE